MFNLGALASSVLDSIDNVAKETLEEPREFSATQIRSSRRKGHPPTTSDIPGKNSELPSLKSLVLSNSREVQETDLNFDDSMSQSSRSHESYVMPTSPGEIETNQGQSAGDVPRDRSNSRSSTGGLPPQFSSSIEQPSNIKKSSNAVSIPFMGSSESLSGLNYSDSELKKVLKKRTQEIESLNRECLELEDQVTSLKQEVQEAWDHYKQAQEKAASREAELQDEIKQIQKAKSTDKQQATNQLGKLTEDINLLVKQLQVLRDEKAELAAQVEREESINKEWTERLVKMEEDLKDARMNSLQGAQNLREELRLAQSNSEQMRLDHSNMIRQLQNRQADLERENAELSQALTGNHFKDSLIRTGGIAESEKASTYLSEENVALQREIIQLSKSNELLQEQKSESDMKLRQAEREVHALQAHHESERQRYEEALNKQSRQIEQLSSNAGSGSPDRLNRTPGDGGYGPNRSESNASSSLEIKELKSQVEHLSKLLLKKQSDVLDAQAERSALKSKVLDLQSKCSQLEQQLANMRDLEEEGFEYNPTSTPAAFASISSSSGSSLGLSQRKGASFGSKSPYLTERNSPKVLSDLEKIGVRPSEGVSRAVTMIDAWAVLTGRSVDSIWA